MFLWSSGGESSVGESAGGESSGGESSVGESSGGDGVRKFTLGQNDTKCRGIIRTINTQTS